MASDKAERIRSEASRLLSAGVAGGVFPGGTACVAYREGSEFVLVESFAGKLDPQGAAVAANTLYDLASVTKPVVATAALRLVSTGKLSFDTRAEAFIADTRGTPGGQATLEQLLSHRAGLAAWGGLYLDMPHEIGSNAARRWMISEAARRPQEGTVKKALYSDLGFMLVGELVAKAAGVSLDRAVASLVTEPIGITDTMFYAGGGTPERRSTLARRAAPTEFCEWRGRVVRGEAHDENAAALGSIAGHAGLFGTASGLAKFGSVMLDVLHDRSTFLSRALLEQALTERPDGSHRVGWDGKSAENSSAGRRMSPRAFGHLGFTGTSLWCDPDRDVAFALLTNRVHPSRANEKIKVFRPAFHDALVACVDG